MRKKYRIALFIVLAMLTFLNIKAQKFSTTIKGKERVYIVRLPQNYDSQRLLPMHLFLHGGGFTIEDAEAKYGFTEHADTSGYILVYPQGLNKSWSRDNDFLFVSSLIDTLCKNYKVDEQAIYVSGHSAGGILVNILACELSHKIAAFGDVSGFMINRDSKYYNPKQPIPYIKVHGTSDEVIPYEGTSDFYSVDSVLSFWKQNNNSQLLVDSEELPNIEDGDSSYVEKYTYGQNRSEIVFYKVVNGGHDVPDWLLNNEMGYTNRDINTPEILWDFFKTHKLKGIKVTFISNSGFLIESGNKKVLIDALFQEGYGYYNIPSERVTEKITNGIPPFDSLDLFLVTHNHGDHFSASLVAEQLENNFSTVLIGTNEVETELKGQFGYNSYSDRIIGLSPDWNSVIDTSAKGISVKILRMHHDTQDMENNAYLFTLDGFKILHVGDYTGAVNAELDTFNLKNENIDIAFINDGCYFSGVDRMDSVKEGIKAKHTILYHTENSNIEKVLDSCNNLTKTTAFRSSFESAYYNVDTSIIINRAPALVNQIPDTVTYVGERIRVKIQNNTFTDTFTDFLFYEVKLSNGSELPAWLSFDPNTKYFSGTPEDIEILPIKVTVTDAAGASVSDVFNLSVERTSGLAKNKNTGEVIVYTDPSNQTIQIKNFDLGTTTFYKITDLSGRQIKEGKLNNGNIDICELNRGMYILNLISVKKSVALKITIE